MRNFFTEVENNKTKTYFIIFLFTLFIVGLCYLASLYYGKGSFASLLGIGLIFSGISSFASYYYSDKMILAMSGAREIQRKDSPEIYNLVENLCLSVGLPNPKVYIIEDTAMNAFATGRDPKHGVVCLTTGIISRLSKQELEGVIAHELAHIGNYDIRLASIVSVLVGTIVFISDWVSHGMFYGGGSSDNRDVPAWMGILFIVLLIASPIIATLIQLAISRNREYLADATAATMTRYPEGLARALEKISGDTEILEAANGATAHLYISNPLKNSGKFIANLFSTHPPIDERIKRLREM
jgi:heat shock protein HtpX